MLLIIQDFRRNIQFPQIMNHCCRYRILLLRKCTVNRMRDQRTQNCCIQTVFEYIILHASKALLKINFSLAVSVRADNICNNILNFLCFMCLQNRFQFILDFKRHHSLKTFKLYILFRHRRHRFCRFKNKKSDQSEAFNILDALRIFNHCRSVIQQNPFITVNRSCKPHSRFQLLHSDKAHSSPPQSVLTEFNYSNPALFLQFTLHAVHSILSVSSVARLSDSVLISMPFFPALFFS